MTKTGLVARYELTATLQRKSYLFISFGVPILALLIFMVVNIIKQDPSTNPEDTSSPEFSELKIEGFVDHAALIEELPQDLPAGILMSFPNEDKAQAALSSGEITAYYIVPQNYVESGELIYVHPSASPSRSDGQEWIMQRTLYVNLLDGDQDLVNKIWNPMNLRATSLAPEEPTQAYGEEDCSTPGYSCESNQLVSMLPLIMVVLFYVFIINGSGLLIRSVTTEKQTRVMEILMASVSPRQLMVGKILGLGIAGVLQTATWLGTVYALLQFGGATLGLPQELVIPPSLLTWGIVYFLLGYGIYASLMAGAGALVPDVKASTSAVWLVILPLIAGYFIAVTPFGQNAPHGLLSTGLSLFPLTAPVAMIMRLTIGGIPAWQLPLGALLMGLTILFVVRVSARMFRAQNLLSGQPFSIRRFFAVFFGAD